MFKKLIKRFIIAATLVCMAGTVAATATACNIETDHPQVRISVEFNNRTYDLEYVLYRNMYPNTVRHFIELTENGYYNNTMIHDYRTNDWFSGGYAYDAGAYEAATLVNAYADYLEGHSLEQKYMDLFNGGKLTPTVFATFSEFDKDNQVVDKDSALPTLVGEFSANKSPEILKGALTAEQGTLKMYYYEKQSTGKLNVLFNDDFTYSRDYKYNCATSIFSMQVGSGSSYGAQNYCVFGKMESTAALNDLIEAVEDYYDSDSGANSVTVDNVKVDSLVEVYSTETEDKGIEESFVLPALPIVIKTIYVTKY